MTGPPARTLASELVLATRQLLRALEEGSADGELASLVDEQLEAFNRFSARVTARTPEIADDVETLLELDRRIMEVANDQAKRLLAQRREMTQQQSVARAFRPSEESSPRFFTQRI